MTSPLWNIDWAGVFTPQYGLAEMALRGTAMYFIIVFLLRLVVRRQLGGVGTTDILVVVLVAEVSGPAFTAESISVVEGGVLLATVLFWSSMIEWLSHRFPAFGRLLEPPAVLLVKNGRVIAKHMRANLITRDELMTHLREEGIESLAQVKSARIEPDGMISVIKADHANP